MTIVGFFFPNSCFFIPKGNQLIVIVIISDSINKVLAIPEWIDRNHTQKESKSKV